MLFLYSSFQGNDIYSMSSKWKIFHFHAVIHVIPIFLVVASVKFSCNIYITKYFDSHSSRNPLSSCLLYSSVIFCFPTGTNFQHVWFIKTSLKVLVPLFFLAFTLQKMSHVCCNMASYLCEIISHLTGRPLIVLSYDSPNTDQYFMFTIQTSLQSGLL